MTNIIRGALSVFIGCAALMAALAKADVSLNKNNTVMSLKGSMHSNRLGVLVGARAHCGLDYEPLFQNWNNRYGMNSKTPEVMWEQMINVAKSTLVDLQADKTACSAEAKAALMSRVQ